MRYHRFSTIVGGHQTELEIGWSCDVRAYWARAVIDLDDKFCTDARVYFHINNGVDPRSLASVVASLTEFGLDVPAALIQALAQDSFTAESVGPLYGSVIAWHGGNGSSARLIAIERQQNRGGRYAEVIRLKVIGLKGE